MRTLNKAPQLSMKKFLAAVIQMNSQPDLDLNMKNTLSFIHEAARQGAGFIALPENFAFLGDENEKLKLTEVISSRVRTKLASWAIEFGIHILAGGYPVRADSGKMYNRASLINPKGEFELNYDKVHLFDVTLSGSESYKESRYVERGRTVSAVSETMQLPPVGLSICYDIRFPELYRKLLDKGAQLLCVPAAFTKPTGKAHWEILLRSRAIENSCFVIAPAQTGKHGKKRETYGHSMIIDPWGTVLVNAGSDPGIAITEIDMARLYDVRKKLPSVSHRVL
jgi:deaminated glutathione amidase